MNGERNTWQSTILTVRYSVFGRSGSTVGAVPYHESVVSHVVLESWSLGVLVKIGGTLLQACRVCIKQSAAISAH